MVPLGLFSSNFLFYVLAKSDSLVSFLHANLVWRSKVPPRFKYFVWLVAGKNGLIPMNYDRLGDPLKLLTLDTLFFA